MIVTGQAPDALPASRRFTGSSGGKAAAAPRSLSRETDRQRSEGRILTHVIRLCLRYGINLCSFREGESRLDVTPAEPGRDRRDRLT